MSKASSAFRRGAVRLSSTLGSGHTALHLLISELSNTRQKHKDLLVAQTSASKCIHKWSQDEGMPALQDVLRHVSGLTSLWTDAQRDYIAALKNYKRLFENILRMNKKLDQAKKSLHVCDERERKLQKELVKGTKDASLTQEKLQLAQDARTLAEAEATSQKRETDALKLASVRAGLLELSQSWSSVGRKCTLMADSQRELALLIPDVNARLEVIPDYTGTPDGQRIIHSLRTQLEQLSPPSYGSEALASSVSFPSSSSSSTTSLPSYDSTGSFRAASSRPSSAGTQGRRGERRKPSSLAPRLQYLHTLDQDDSFDSFDSD